MFVLFYLTHSDTGFSSDYQHKEIGTKLSHTYKSTLRHIKINARKEIVKSSVLRKKCSTKCAPNEAYTKTCVKKLCLCNSDVIKRTGTHSIDSTTGGSLNTTHAATV